MLQRKEKEEQVNLIAACSRCGKPVLRSARTAVTRYLTRESRCQCPESPHSSSSDPASAAKPESESQSPNANQPAEPGSITPPSWLEAVIANLPDHYEVLALLGEGGAGAVLKVRDTRLNKVLAVKLLRPDLAGDEQALKRFEREAKSANNLTHANICATYDIGIGKQSAPYLVMDYVEGSCLSELIAREGFLAVPRALDLFIQIADGISHAHLKGIIHRDIKPTNIIVTENDNGIELAKLVDFGIAKILPTAGEHATQALTQTGEIFGSPLYMSPEQCEGNELDERSDIYSLGCVMYEALSGQPPLSGANPIKTILKHIKEQPRELSDSCSKQPLSSDLSYIVMRCLHKDPADRYQNMQDLKDDLQRYFEQKRIKRLLPKAAGNAQTKRGEWQPKHPFVLSSIIVACLVGLNCILVSPLAHRSGNSATSSISVATQPSNSPNRNQAIKLNNEAVRLLNKGSYQDAYDKLRSALDLDPKYMIARNNLSITCNNWALSLRRTPEKALEKFHMAQYLKPDDAVVNENIIGLLKMMGKDPTSFDDRVSIAQKALSKADVAGALVEYQAAMKIKYDSDIKQKVENLSMVNFWHNPQGDQEQQSRPKLSSFMREFEKRVKAIWTVDATASGHLHAVLSFNFMNADGQIDHIQLKTSSGDQKFDQSCLQAVRSVSAPHLPPTSTFPVPVEFTFDNND